MIGGGPAGLPLLGWGAGIVVHLAVRLGSADPPQRSLGTPFCTQRRPMRSPIGEISAMKP